MSSHIDFDAHPIGDTAYGAQCKRVLDGQGALVLEGFFRAESIEQIVVESLLREHEVFYAGSTHNVYLTPSDPDLPGDHPFNQQVASSKGLIADDQIPNGSPLRDVYDSAEFQAFLCAVLGIDAIYPYDDSLSSINVHFADEGRELGWHFDNSSFAVTMLIQAPEGGGSFDYVPAVRDADAGEMNYDMVGAVLDGNIEPTNLSFEPGDLVLFRGRNALHRVTPTIGGTTRMLVVFAYNTEPGIGLSDSAKQTFYGRL